MDMLDRLLESDRWATNTLLEASRGLTDEQLDQRFDIGNGMLRYTFGHFIYNISFWTALMEGRRIGEPDIEGGDWSIAGMTAMHERLHAEFAALSRQFRDDGRLDETYIDHYDAKKSFIGTILMVLLHNEGHRTEVAHMLARLGVSEVPEVDHGLWDYLRLNE